MKKGAGRVQLGGLGSCSGLQGWQQYEMIRTEGRVHLTVLRVVRVGIQADTTRLPALPAAFPINAHRTTSCSTACLVSPLTWFLNFQTCFLLWEVGAALQGSGVGWALAKFTDTIPECHP